MQKPPRYTHFELKVKIAKYKTLLLQTSPFDRDYENIRESLRYYIELYKDLEEPIPHIASPHQAQYA